ncbi:MAG: cyclic pyranopterin monophosphate synthase MoaC [Lachnospiraceae bacterium]
MEMNHFDKDGNAIMVDVSEKQVTARTAVAAGRILVGEEVFERIRNHSIEKGDVLGVARVAGIMAVKRTGELIPMCHPLMILNCSVDFHLFEDTYEIEAVCTVKTEGKTGVEMEALTGASTALLTIYDMCKALNRGMVISGIHVRMKSGGKSGTYESI